MEWIFMPLPPVCLESETSTPVCLEEGGTSTLVCLEGHLEGGQKALWIWKADIKPKKIILKP